MAVSQFIKEGHRDIAFIGGEASHPSLNERLRAARRRSKTKVYQ